MKRTIFAAMLIIAGASHTFAQVATRGQHDGETFELSTRLPNEEINRYTANNYIKLLPGFASKPVGDNTSLLNIGLDELGIYPPDNGLTNENGCVVGTLGGSVNVGTMGALAYSIPLEIPAGINGMQPNLSIDYNSQGGNGLLGWGWDLGGLSCISRSGQTLYHDGKMTAADLTIEDRFMLDGQRLVLVEGSYGSNKSKYKTENDCFSKITFYTRGAHHDKAASSNGSYFEVWDKSGNKLFYESKLCTINGNTAVLWMISRIMDRWGNAITYRYEKDNEKGEIYIKSIRYTENQGQGETAQFEVVFDYSRRNDFEFYYIGGNPLIHKYLLDNITVTSLLTQKKLFRYRFKYVTPSNANKRLYSILTSIQMDSFDENGQSEKYNVTSIEWDKTDPCSVIQRAIPNPTVFENFPFTGDFNGDGYTDVAMVPYKREGQKKYDAPVDIRIYLNNRDGGFEHAPSLDLPQMPVTLDWVYVLDINDDGLDDIVPYFYDTIEERQARENTAILFYQNVLGHSFNLIAGHDISNKGTVITGDFDGNGTNDVILLEKKMYDSDPGWFSTDNRPHIEAVHFFGYQNGSFQGRTLNRNALKRKYGPVYDAVAADFNGDGTTEVLLVGAYSNNYQTIQNDGTKLAKFNFQDSDNCITIMERFPDYASIPCFDSENGRWCYTFTGDFNGDGKADIIFYKYSKWRLRYFKGDTFGYALYDSFPELPSLLGDHNIFAPSLTLVASIPSHIRKRAFVIADFDGDGCSDICYTRASDNMPIIVSRLSTANPSPNSTEYDIRRSILLDSDYSFSSQFVHVGNFLGRDNTSFLCSLQPSSESKPSTAVIVSPYSVNTYNSVVSITDGLGNKSIFDYDILMPKPQDTEIPFYDFSFSLPDRYGIHRVPIAARALSTYKAEGINGSSIITKYRYENAYYHRHGHGFMGFEKTTTETYRNTLAAGWKSRKVSLNECTTMERLGMMLPKYEYNYINENGQPVLVGRTTYNFKKVTLLLNKTVVCPAMVSQKDETYSLDDGHARTKTVAVGYEYDYSNDFTYTSAYGCTKMTNQTYDGQGNLEMEMEKVCKNQTSATHWILNRPETETITLKRNGESIATTTNYVYRGAPEVQYYEPSIILTLPNDGHQATDPKAVMNTFEYDSFGNIKKIAKSAPYGEHGEEDRIKEYEYGSQYQHRLVTKEVNGEESDGYATTYRYDIHDRLLKATDCNGKTIRHETSPLAVTAKTFPIDDTEQRSVTLWAKDSPYKPEGASYYIWSKKTGGVTSMTFFHKSGLELRNVTFDINGVPVFADKIYNEKGLLEKESAPYRQGEAEDNIIWTEYEYDVLERPVNTLYPDGSEQSIDYHGLTTATTLTSPQGTTQKSTKRLNALGWLSESIEAVETNHPTSIHYEYYADGNLKWTRINDDEATTIRLEYDQARNRTLLHDPDYCTPTNDLTSVYNAFGEEVGRTTPKGLTTTFAYDKFGRMTTRIEEETIGSTIEAKTTQWNYHEAWPHKGLLSSIEHPEQTITYNYDSYQRVNMETVSFTNGETYNTYFGYDEASRRAWVHYPSGFAHYYDYNDIGHLYRLSHNYGCSETYRVEQTTPWGQVERYSLDRDIFVNLEYHPEKHKLTHILTTQGENILQNLRYDYDGFSNLASRKDEERDLEEHFTYDHLNRLTEVWRDGIMRSWMEYDAYGRMTKKVADNRPLFSQAVFHPDKPHAMASASTYYGLFPDGEQNITYTSFDKVKRIVQDGNTIEYAYGYDRQRIFMEEHVGSTTRTKRYLGNCELLTVTTDEDTVSTQWLTYLAGPTGVYAVVTTDTEGTHTIHYVLKDNLGSWATITDRHGNIEQELSYDPWGTRRNPDTWHTHNNQNLEAPMFDRGYTGHEHLYVFGLINMNGRMYDPLTSSFLSVDAYVQSPDNAQSFNRYAYCQNNPLRYVDPSGWYMQGASYGTPITGSSWGTSYSQHAYEPRELGMLQLPDCSVMTWWMEGETMLGGGGGGGSNDAVNSQYQLIRHWQDNPSYRTNLAMGEAGISNVTIGTIYGQVNGQDGYRNSYYFWEDEAGVSHSAFALYEYVGGHESGVCFLSNQPLDMYFLSNPDDIDKANILTQSLGIPFGTIQNGMECAAKAYHNVPVLTGKLTQTQYVNALTREGVGMMKVTRGLGIAGAAASTFINGYQTYDYYFNQGGKGWQVAAKSTGDLVMTVVGFCGPVGFCISVGYFVIDIATDGFGVSYEVKP